jgi:hypothetical protein
MGMTAGNLTGMRFRIQNLGSSLKNLRVRARLSNLDTLSNGNFDPSGFSQLYLKNTTFTDTGWVSLQFTTPFQWDGISNLIIEVSYANGAAGTDNAVYGGDVGFAAALTNSGSDRCVTFHNGAYARVPVNPQLALLDTTISVSFWAFGIPQYQPQDGTCFEGLDSSGNRVINVHLPWSNSNIYWDAGNTGGSYDRINKAATVAEIEGRWNYWTFTKNAAAGSLKIYLNGVPWHSGTSLTRIMQPLNQLVIGKGNWSGAQSYEGRMDEFSIFGVELDTTTIQQYLGRPIDAMHPNYGDLLVYYPFDDGNYQFAVDSAPGGNDDATLISVDNALKSPDDLVYGFTESSIRPDVMFEMGSYLTSLDSVFVQDSVMNLSSEVVFFTDTINNIGVGVDTLYVWPAGYYNYSRNGDGIIVDSLWVAVDSSLYKDYFDYYNYFPQVIRFELARYITPYGNGLSLGNGWTWTFDVSDYRTLLSDSVHLSAGNWQELLDMKFLFVEGTPTREVYNIQNLWNGGFNYGQSGDPIESHLVPKSIVIPDSVAGARWKSRITGHGMDTPQNCAEFCPKHHYFKVDGVQQYDRLVWRDNCDLNPLFPQGGTWVYDRSNWCPGAEVWTYDMEISSFITPGDTVILDHDAQPYTSTGGWDYYQIEDQLVTYGPPNFSLDAAIVRVLSPTGDKMWARLNPICMDPSIVIRNNGTTPLTSLDIQYGIEGAVQSTYHWTGSLNFLEETTVALDSFVWAQGASAFTFAISEPNGGVDEYAFNDQARTAFTYPMLLPSTFVIALKTNNNPWENSYTLHDASGNLIHSRSGLTANTTYSDTLNLTEGCYEFRLLDSGEDGLTWWANTGQGNGSLRFRSATMTTQVYKNFGSDFGGEIYVQFTVGLSSSIQDYICTDHAKMSAYPNPATDKVTIDVDLPYVSDGAILIRDLLGNVVQSTLLEPCASATLEVDVSGLESGLYFVQLDTHRDLLSVKLVVAR